MGAAAFAIAAVLLYRALREYSVAEIAQSLRTIDASRIAAAIAFTAGSFVALFGVDALAVRYTGRTLAFRKVALASFTALSIGHVLGFAALSTGALRYRFYSSWGLSAGDIGRVVLFCGVTVALGFATVGGVAALLRRGQLAELTGVNASWLAGAGALALLAVGAYLAATALKRGARLSIRRFELPLPSLPLAAGQVACGSADALLVAAAMHQLVSAAAGIDYLLITAAYVGGNAIGIATHVPGGLGVIEAVVVWLVPGAHVVAGLVAFRVAYYLLPFALGCAAFFAAELHRRRRGRTGEASRHRSRAAAAASRGPAKLREAK